tara:strand:- start:1282 stop:1467 length:186 start_codon:yes stop_codon:yes gene_type:complete
MFLSFFSSITAFSGLSTEVYHGLSGAFFGAATGVASVLRVLFGAAALATGASFGASGFLTG